MQYVGVGIFCVVPGSGSPCLRANTAVSQDVRECKTRGYPVSRPGGFKVPNDLLASAPSRYRLEVRTVQMGQTRGNGIRGHS